MTATDKPVDESEVLVAVMVVAKAATPFLRKVRTAEPLDDATG